MPGEPVDVTRLLNAARAGQAEASHRLVSLLYDKLRELAADLMKGERREHTVQPTALVHEAWIRLVGRTDIHWDSRGHFYGAAARAMRRFLVDYARQHKAARRDPGQGKRMPLEAAEDVVGNAFLPADPEVDLEALEAALKKMEADEQLREKCRIVELHCFAGLTHEETARVLDRSVASVKRDWTFAKAWLRREIPRDG